MADYIQMNVSPASCIRVTNESQLHIATPVLFTLTWSPFNTTIIGVSRKSVSRQQLFSSTGHGTVTHSRYLGGGQAEGFRCVHACPPPNMSKTHCLNVLVILEILHRGVFHDNV